MKAKILLVDDDKDIHNHLQIIFNAAGYDFYSAFSGDEGLKKIQAIHPDLVILDYMMPGKNGYETFKELQQSAEFEKYRNIPVIMLTAYNQTHDDIKNLLEHGLNAFLEKPFGHNELLNIIQNTFVTNEIKIKNNELKDTIEKTKNFLENLIASCPVIIITTDREGRITFVSKAMKDILEYKSEELVGKKINYLLESDQATVDEIIQQLTPTNPFLTTEFYLPSKYNKFVPMGITFSLLKDFDENVQGLLIVGQDLSDQKRLEKELLEKERLIAITESLATINHELNNPLTPILGNLQLIRKNETALPTDMQKKLDIIEQNAKRIFHIIQKFNAISKPVRRTYYGDSKMIDFQN